MTRNLWTTAAATLLLAATAEPWCDQGPLHSTVSSLRLLNTLVGAS